ncbi:hypothetical protein AB0M22_13795 [Nocardia sp. NPDC051756]|uniref:hypothetical protein n=1 Tax=Nocardia sp. NPDC051756 TaxID=3154751 RepID=UPI0034483858
MPLALDGLSVAQQHRAVEIREFSFADGVFEPGLQCVARRFGGGQEVVSGPAVCEGRRRCRGHAMTLHRAV